jgi:hypothetical protein
VSLFLLSPDIEDRDEAETFQLLRVEVFQVRLQKKATSAVSIEIHKGAIFDRLKIHFFNSVLIFSSTAFLF